MRFPLRMAIKLAIYMGRNRLWPNPAWQRNSGELRDNAQYSGRPNANPAGNGYHPLQNKKFPLVLMLEPLHACNLTCTGCGRIREYRPTITQKLSLSECLRAVDECPAPVVTICGGEPLLYPEIPELVEQVLARDRYIYLCTNGLLLRKRLHEFRPDPRFYFNIHLDGLEQTHDAAVERPGVFREAIQAIRAAKQAGFKVSTNTTVYKDTDMKEIAELFEYLKQFGVDAHMLSPAYSYEAVEAKEIFLTREDIRAKFRGIEELARRYPLTTSPLYLEFLAGRRELPCTAWANPTFNVQGWRSPCYLLADRHYSTFVQLMTETPWQRYGPGRDPRCEHCMVHCGFEPSAALGLGASWRDGLRLIRWALR